MISMNKYNPFDGARQSVSPTSSSACMMRWINRRCANRPPGRYGAAAACLVLIIGGTAVMQMNRTPAKSGWRGNRLLRPLRRRSMPPPMSWLPLCRSRWRCRRPCRMAIRSTRHPISSAWLLLCMRTRKDIHFKYCMGKGEDALTGMNHTVSGEKLEGTDALLLC